LSEAIRTVSPIDGRLVCERPLADGAPLDALLGASRRAARAWRATPVSERVAVVERACEALLRRREEIGREVTLQMGRPIRHSPIEVDRAVERARHMAGIAEEALADIRVGEREGFERFIRRVPLGVVLVVAPWNYPFLTAVNALAPALLAGNAVLLKPSAQTPLSGDRFCEAFAEAGLPPGVLQQAQLSHQGVAQAIGSPEVEFVAFTGSVEGGHAVQQAASGRFIATGLELGGKDPAYVCADAPFEHTVEGLVDGAFFNAGQSCCGIERIYVDASLHDRFVEAFAAATREYVLGDPLRPDTTLGPMVRTSAAETVRRQVADAISSGARARVEAKEFPGDRPGTPYLGPQVLVDVEGSMRVMREESFGPVVGIERVASDEEAVERMNDSAYGLTASIWTGDLERARRLGDQVETGTWFMNRCDYLDPALAWTGVKDSGRGVTLSRLGFEPLTRPKSFHLRVRP